jgi:hypothetical protein
VILIEKTKNKTLNYKGEKLSMREENPSEELSGREFEEN